MPKRNTQLTQVGRRQVEVSNLGKLLFPADEVSKAEVINYYLTLAPTLLAQIKGRPLTVVRYPEGINGQVFFQKNRPEWSPDWLEHAVLGSESTDYIIAGEAAALVWLANLACIELHQMHSRAPHFDKPDYVVYDFDPPEKYAFPELAAVVRDFREHVEAFGYHSFVKTTGRKGLHVVTPIEPKWDFQTVFEAAKAVAEPFVSSHNSALTLQLKKERRQGKVLLDIYRNRPSQTIVSAYSLRGIRGATVSTPLHWEELETLQTPGGFNIHTVPPRVTAGNDPWESLAGYAVGLHTQRRAVRVATTIPKKARTYKTPAQLESYSTKRSFKHTPEPRPAPLSSEGSAFVVHRHHASRLHYDLRLEHEGVLRSWAVPKGLPPRPGIMRLAVQVEDHPIEYVGFEGTIPKGEYGGGQMWKFAQGRHEITKQKKHGFYFRLESPELTGEYRIHNTREKQWLLERVDTPQLDWVRGPVQPMLACPSDGPRDSKNWLYEVKWDGIRALISLDEGEVRIRGRNGIDLTRQFPELLPADSAFRATSALFDGEIVCLDSAGKPVFSDVISRMQQRSTGAVDRLRARHPAVCYLFDCLYLDGRSIVNEPLFRRREWLADTLKEASAYRLSGAFEDGVSLLEAVRQHGLEGVMAKRKDSSYLPGKRSDSWLKIKPRRTAECLIIGYTAGQGDRAGSFGALHLAQPENGELRYVGKVGSGFDESSLKAVFAILKDLTTSISPVKHRPTAPGSVWVEPKLACEVAFASFTGSGILREPVFVRLRPDLSY